MKWRRADDWAHGKCRAVRTEGRQHQIRPSEYYRADHGYAPWLMCVNCKEILWGLYTIHEEEDPI